jgi:putative pyruvate formate lyase activating enzyme
MMRLQNQGVHNINFVTPGHYLPQILAALYLAIPLGFNLPLVWNSSGYEKVDVLRMLEGVVDIYLPDMKYSDDRVADELSGALSYRDHNRSAVMEMFRQVGNLKTNGEDIAVRGVLIRHLVLPRGLSGSRNTIRWLSETLGRQVHIAVMSQYFPAFEASKSPDLNQRVAEEEYEMVVETLEEFGLEHGWVQDYE